MGKEALLVGVLFLAVGIGGGCAARQATEKERSAGDLLILGKEDLSARNFERAREAFNRILREYPESHLRSEALLSLADSFYAAKEYQEAKFQYEKFVQLYPVNPQTARAYYFLGMSDFQRLNAIDRDQTLTREALKNFRKLAAQFPGEPHVEEALPKVRILEEKLAQNQYYISEFYYRKGLYHSAIPRLEELLKEFPKTSVADAALYLLGESYRHEESHEKAASAYRRLLADYPSSRYRSRSESRLRQVTNLR
jgi:outer membrane protein assembly factor BamD